MTQITGIGGIFFRAKDPDMLAAWYNEVFGVGHVWEQQKGHTIFAPFPADTEYFGRAEQGWMINFRVADLDALLVQLRARQIEVLTDPAWDSNVGRFARIHDPEGNPIELWEPAHP